MTARRNDNDNELRKRNVWRKTQAKDISMIKREIIKFISCRREIYFFQAASGRIDALTVIGDVMEKEYYVSRFWLLE